MSQRRTQPAPAFIKWFWGGAIVSAVILGPLLFLRADWMWSKNLSEAASARALDERTTAEAVRARLRIDALRGEPFVAHVIVALADNVHQAIVPVPATLGDGDAPQSNLYWGARYGLRAFFENETGWTLVGAFPPPDDRVLERVVFTDRVTLDGVEVDAYVVADAWRGAAIEAATAAFLRMAAGYEAEKIAVGENEIRAGGNAHVVAWIGHDGLMDFELPELPEPRERVGARSAIVLACASESYFVEPLRSVAAHPLLLTTGNMAPEAYTLDRALRRWWAEAEIEAVHDAAAEAYAEYQQISVDAARKLFVTLPE